MLVISPHNKWLQTNHSIFSCSCLDFMLMIAPFTISPGSSSKGKSLTRVPGQYHQEAQVQQSGLHKRYRIQSRRTQAPANWHKTAFYALILQIPDFLDNGDQLSMGLVGLITAAISGFLSLKLLKKVVLKGKLSYFGIYCLLLGIIVLIIPSISFWQLLKESILSG